MSTDQLNALKADFEDLKWRANELQGQVSDLRHENEQLHEEIEYLNSSLQFVERWVNHHGTKPHVTAEEVLGIIQHYPPIKRIIKSYDDSIVPSTPNLFEREPLTDEQVFNSDDFMHVNSSLLHLSMHQIMIAVKAIEKLHNIGN